MDSYAKMTQKRVLLYLLLSFVLNCIPLLKKAPKSFFEMDYAKTLHPSSIPWNPLCLSGVQGLNGTNLPFITLHHPSSPVISSHFLSFKLFSVRYELTSLTFLFVKFLL